MKIREYKAEDHEALCCFWLESGIGLDSTDSAEELAKAQLLNPGLFLIAESEEGTICGSVLGLFNGRRRWINHLAVSPLHRKQGIARKLLAELEKRLISRGCPQLNLHILPSNSGVSEFYEKVGYLRKEVIYMAKRL